MRAIQLIQFQIGDVQKERDLDDNTNVKSRKVVNFNHHQSELLFNCKRSQVKGKAVSQLNKARTQNLKRSRAHLGPLVNVGGGFVVNALLFWSRKRFLSVYKCIAPLFNIMKLTNPAVARGAQPLVWYIMLAGTAPRPDHRGNIFIYIHMAPLSVLAPQRLQDCLF